MKSLIILAFVTLFTFTSLHAHAQTLPYPVGQIAHIEGSAYSIKGQNKKDLKEGDPIYLGNALHTNADSKMLLLLIDDTRITLGEKAQLIIDEFIFDPYDSQDNKAELSIKHGPFYWISGMISKKENPDIVIHNSFGSIGIRGTRLWGGEIDNGYGVIVDEGHITFSGFWGSRDLTAGTSTFITKAKAVEDENFWSPANKIRAQKTITFKMDEELMDEKLAPMFRKNIRKRNDYRGKMYPYKENPFRPKITEEKDDEFFSEEFKDLQKKNK